MFVLLSSTQQHRPDGVRRTARYDDDVTASKPDVDVVGRLQQQRGSRRSTASPADQHAAAIAVLDTAAAAADTGLPTAARRHTGRRAVVSDDVIESRDAIRIR